MLFVEQPGYTRSVNSYYKCLVKCVFVNVKSDFLTKMHYHSIEKIQLWKCLQTSLRCLLCLSRQMHVIFCIAQPNRFLTKVTLKFYGFKTLTRPGELNRCIFIEMVKHDMNLLSLDMSSKQHSPIPFLNFLPSWDT